MDRGKQAWWDEFHKLCARKKERNEEGRELVIWLDHDSLQRLQRLRGKLKGFDDGELIAFALKSLECRMKSIVKKRLLRKIRTLEKKGLLSQQIADRLNKQGVPPPGQANKWHAGTIARFSDENQEGMPNQDRKKARRR